MKTALVIAGVLGATQCLPAEPSGSTHAPPTEEPATTAGAAPDAGGAAQATPDLAWLKAGPAPFTVPTERIALAELGVSMIVPRGARGEAAETGIRVSLGEGRNFAMYVSADAVALADTADRVGSELADGEPRPDGAMVWQEDGMWRFEMRDALTCWNAEGSRHGADDVETMIASCRSAEKMK